MKLYKGGEYAEAERLFRHALTICPADDPQLAVVYNNLAATLEKRLMPRDAEALYLKAIAICEERMAPDHPRVKHIRKKLAELQATLMQFPGLPPAVAVGAVEKAVALQQEDFVSE